ncbi:MAG: flagellar export protein FliJ [Lachnospiraceae bacterium]
MKKFIYPMESILNIQYKLEDQAKTLFGEASMKLLQEEEVLVSLMDKKKGYEEKAKELVEDKLDLPAIRECKSAIEVMKTKIRAQMIEVHVAEKNVEHTRRKLQEAMVTRKSHEVLKEKAFVQYKKEWADEENKSIDELVSYKHAAKVIR